MTIIPISRELRERIDKAKGKKSYEEYLDILVPKGKIKIENTKKEE